MSVDKLMRKNGGFNPIAFRCEIEDVIARHFDLVADNNKAGFNLFDEAVDASVRGVLKYAMQRNDNVQHRAAAWLRKNRTTVRQQGARVGVAGFRK